MLDSDMDETEHRLRPQSVLSVTELNLQVRQQIERSFPLLWVGGEISNFVRATSEHWYFTLKDAKAQVRCAMFRNRNQHAEWIPSNGDAVEVNALVTLYEARGDYQLIVETVRRAGLGALYEKFLKLKARLEAEGLFDPARKRPLPAFPKRIGVITSPAAAALRDVLTTLTRRAPHIPVVLYPTAVQGSGSAAEIVQAISSAGAREECDVLILCRGGGSIEDLWSFNEEIVARAIVACPIPIVAGIGHETDFTIADFVADERAPTPTAAAQRVAPDRGDLLAGLLELKRRANVSLQRIFQAQAQRLDQLTQRLIHPGARIQQQRQQLDQLAARLRVTQTHRIEILTWQLQHLEQRFTARKTSWLPLQERVSRDGVRMIHALRQTLALRSGDLQRLAGNFHHLNPTRVMERGYSVIRDDAGTIVKSSAQISVGQDLQLSFARGEAVASVKQKTSDA
jgi:exodeoxyribonuclease VII large subunit